MPTTTNVKKVKVNKMTSAQYQSAVKDNTQFYFITDAPNFVTEPQLNNSLATKQNVISDLETIRSNATAGNTAATTIATYGNIVTHNTSEFATAAQGTKADSALQTSDIINNTESTATSKALSANMGKELSDRLDNVEGRGRYLSQWNCATGLPATNPTSSPYEYHKGDYYIVGTIATGSGTNYRPNGSSYTTGVASTTVETESVFANDTYIYDGTYWILQRNVSRDISFQQLTGLPTDNTNLATALNSKVNGNATITASVTKKLVSYDSKGLVTGGSALSSSDVVTALGFTPYSASNPNGYVNANYHDDSKVDANDDITGATKCKITYDSKGLVTAGADLSASDIPNLSLSKITDVTASATELNYCDGVTSNIQTQLNGKQGTLPTLQSGKYLTNNGTTLSWASVDALPSQSGQSGKFLTTDGTTASWDYNSTNKIGEIIQVACTADYIPDGCLPCDGAEYTKAQFLQLWTNYLTSSPAKLLTCSYADYQTDITTYGQCAKFAIDTVNNKFKVPTLPNKLVTGQVQNVPVKGTSQVMISKDGGATVTGLRTAYENQGSVKGLLQGTSWATTQDNLPVQIASSNSGIVADLSTNTVTLRSFVVISNGQINQASMDWSQWATSLAGRLDTNASNATATGKETINGWGIPDYSAGITKYKNVDYTSSVNGWLFIYSVCYGQSGITTVTIDGIVLTLDTAPASNHWANSVALLPIKKNSTYRIGFTNTNSDSVLTVVFYPMLGG